MPKRPTPQTQHLWINSITITPEHGILRIISKARLTNRLQLPKLHPQNTSNIWLFHREWRGIKNETQIRLWPSQIDRAHQSHEQVEPPPPSKGVEKEPVTWKTAWRANDVAWPEGKFDVAEGEIPVGGGDTWQVLEGGGGEGASQFHACKGERESEGVYIGLPFHFIALLFFLPMRSLFVCREWVSEWQRRLIATRWLIYPSN